MTVQHSEDKNGGRFFIADEGSDVAEMTYIREDPQTIVIDHTEVDEALQGQRIGYDLVDAAVEYARQQGLKITPVCVFAAAVFQKKKEYADVLKES